jgi:hypothetical protein
LTGPVKYKAKQLRAEAEDLLGKNSDVKSDDDDDEMDPKYRMRKVSLSILWICRTFSNVTSLLAVTEI